MDPYRGKVLERGAGTGWAEEIRTALGLSRQMAGRIDLLHCIPSGHLSSSSYCLARHDREYLVYVPEGEALLHLKKNKKKARSPVRNPAREKRAS